MRIKVDEITLQASNKCVFGFGCLQSDKFPQCSVTRYIDGDGLFIKDPNQNICPYKVSFGYSYMCSCPTRKEIYKKYDK